MKTQAIREDPVGECQHCCLTAVSMHNTFKFENIHRKHLKLEWIHPNDNDG